MLTTYFLGDLWGVCTLSRTWIQNQMKKFLWSVYSPVSTDLI